jgi:hypothetical protein
MSTGMSAGSPSVALREPKSSMAKRTPKARTSRTRLSVSVTFRASACSAISRTSRDGSIPASLMARRTSVTNVGARSWRAVTFTGEREGAARAEFHLPPTQLGAGFLEHPLA